MLMVIAILIVFGLCLGSFVNALVWRLHEQSNTKNKKKLQELSISKGRSQCSNCGHKLAPKDLIPLLSWLSLRGKCRYCHKPIKDSPMVEVILPIILVISYFAWPYVSANEIWTNGEIAAFGVWVLIATGLLALAVYDVRWYLLPDKIVFPLTILGVVFVALVAAAAGHNSGDIVLDAALGAITIFGLFYLLFQLSKGTWIGGGDVKLAVLLGLLAGGFMEALLLLFLASLLGTVYALALGVSGKKSINRRLRIPFGPFLIAATFIVVLWGVNIIDWYSDLILSV
jgi:prepilin signal peptidase PulO-like enzyme (type II secretory pathway)